MLMRNDRIISALLSVAIAVVFVLFITFGVSTFYDAPQYEDYYREILDNQMAGV